MKVVDVRAKTDDELAEQLDVFGREIFNLRFQRANGQLENTARVRQVRRDIARIKSVLGERIRAVPRLRQRLYLTPPGCGRPYWADDPAFDINEHVRQVCCPGGTGRTRRAAPGAWPAPDPRGND